MEHSNQERREWGILACYERWSFALLPNNVHTHTGKSGGNARTLAISTKILGFGLLWFCDGHILGAAWGANPSSGTRAFGPPQAATVTLTHY